jgi:carbonic anhydrase
MNLTFLTYACVFLLFFLIMYVSINTKKTPTITTPDQALEFLLEGNKVFNSPWQITKKKYRQATAFEQKPFAIILNCSDSRVPTEIIFNQLNVGSLFVIRNAGNVIAGTALGSIEYGIEQLGAVLIIVLGHERCGAVMATVDACINHSTSPSKNIQKIINAITPAVEKVIIDNNITMPCDAATKSFIVSESIKENVRLEMNNLYTSSDIIKKAVDAQKIKIVGAYYDLDDGNVKIIG